MKLRKPNKQNLISGRGIEHIPRRKGITNPFAKSFYGLSAKNHKALLRIMNKYWLPAQPRRRRKYRQIK